MLSKNKELVKNTDKKINLIFAVDKISYNDRNHIGVRNKVSAQVLFFDAKGINVSLIEYEWDGGYPNIQVQDNTDVLYFRTIEPSAKLVKYLNDIRRKHKMLRIVMEIPTYPFVLEDLSAVSIKRRINRHIGDLFLHKVVDRVVMIGMNHTMNSYLNIPVIHATNGVTIENELISRHDYVESEINLIAVSGCYFWHGYERIIRGLGHYYKSTDRPYHVKLHMVGEGECLELYKSEALRYGLGDDNVIFYGALEGEDLNKVYELADISVNALAIHRKGLDIDGSLKSREAFSRGIPIITGAMTDIENEDVNEFILHLPPDESDIDINDIIDFYINIMEKIDAKSMHMKISSLADKYYGWDNTFKDVLMYILKD